MERQFKGVWIPAKIWLDTELTPTEKILLADIDSFTGNGKIFYKSNETLSKELHTSVSTVKRSVKALSQRNYISIKGTTRQRLITSLIDSVQNEPNRVDQVQIERHKVQNDLDKVQNDLSLGSKCTPTNTVTNTVTNTILTKGVVFPFNGKDFLNAWAMWLDERKSRRYGKYTQRGEQSALHKLQKDSNDNEVVAIEIINQSVANSWRGLFALKNDKRNNKKEFDTGKYNDYLESL